MLSIGTNWDGALLDGLKSIDAVTDLYGCLPRHVTGHGRPAASVPQVTREQVEEHVREARKTGFSFTYLLNAPGMGGRQFDRDTRRRILEHLDWLSSIPVDAITVSLADLVHLIKRRYPHFKVKASHNCLIRRVPQAKMFEESGADMLTLHQTATRDFHNLKLLLKEVRIPVQIICTIDCMPGCPNSVGYHMSGTSTLSSERAELNEHNRHASGYCFAWCHLKKAQAPEEILKGGFVRPEDLPSYEAVGITDFKIDTRVLTTPVILARARAFAQRTYSGDLKRLLSVFSLGYKTRRGTQMGGGHESAKCEVRSAESDFFELTKHVDFATLLAFPNEKIDGFLKHFLSAPCGLDCGTCDYCAAWAERSMTWDEGNRRKLVEILKTYREWLLNR